MRINSFSTNMIICSAALFSFSQAAFPGFEIGNAKTIENLPGRYKITVPSKTEVGSVKTYTEAIAPLSEGTPRTRLQINLVTENNMNSVANLIDSRLEENWSPINLSGLSGIKKEVTVSTGLSQVEVRLFLRPGKIIVINLEGVPSPSPLSPFEVLKDSIETFKVLQ